MPVQTSLPISRSAEEVAQRVGDTQHPNRNNDALDNEPYLQPVAGPSTSRPMPPSQLATLKQELHIIRSERIRTQRQHLKEVQRLEEKLASAAEREKDQAKEKTALLSELTDSQKESRLVSQREHALRVALEKAEANVKIGLDKGQKYNGLQRKVEELERLHEDGKKKHQSELDLLRSQLEGTRKAAEDRKRQGSHQQRREAESENTIKDLKRRLAEAQAEGELARIAHREACAAADAREARSRARLEELERTTRAKRATEVDAVRGQEITIKELENSLTEERKRHEATRTKLLDLQSALDATDGRANSRTQELETKLAKAREQSQKLQSKQQTLESAVAALEQELQASKLGLDGAKNTLRVLTSEYGRLAESSVGKKTYEEMRFERMRYELLANKLQARVEDRDAQVKELTFMIRAGVEAREHLMSLAEERASDLQVVVHSFQDALMEERVANTDRDQQSTGLQTAGHLVRQLMKERSEGQYALMDVDIHRLGTLSDYYRTQFHDSAQAADVIGDAYDQAVTEMNSAVQSLATSESLCEKLEAEKNKISSAHHVAIDQLQKRDAELQVAQAATVVLRSNLEKMMEDLRDDVRKAESSMAKEMDKAAEWEKVVTQSRMCEEGLRADIEGLVEQLESAGRYQEAYTALMKEVGVLVSRNALAEDEADHLSRVNVEILSHTNASQKIFYVDKIRRELAETKQKLITTTVELETTQVLKADLIAELATYKSLSAPIESKPKTHLTRVQRVPLAVTSRANYGLSRTGGDLKGDVPLTISELR